MFIPASIITGIGSVLYYQNATGDWASWSYLWTLIPGFVAFGLLLFGLLTRKRGAYIAGLWNLFGSLLFFGIFGLRLWRDKLCGCDLACCIDPAGSDRAHHGISKAQGESDRRGRELIQRFEVGSQHPPRSSTNSGWVGSFSIL